MYVYVYVCMCVCMYVCVRVYAYACVCMSGCVPVRSCMCVCEIFWLMMSSCGGCRVCGRRVSCGQYVCICVLGWCWSDGKRVGGSGARWVGVVVGG